MVWVRANGSLPNEDPLLLGTAQGAFPLPELALAPQEACESSGTTRGRVLSPRTQLPWLPTEEASLD